MLRSRAWKQRCRARPRPRTLDVAGVRRSFEARVRSAGALDQAAARRLLARLPPDRWTLEWYLPWWLGNALGLDQATSHELVLSNLLGLASIRLQDDLADGETGDGPPTAPRLAAALYEAALVPYASRFEPESPFWEHLDRCMATWRAAATDTSGDHRLAARGAPLKIAPFAECLLADRIGDVPGDRSVPRSRPRGARSLRPRRRLASGSRGGALERVRRRRVERSAGAPKHARGHGQAVLLAMLTTDVVTTQFATIRDGFLAAAEIAADLARTDDLPLPDLVDHLRRRAADAEAQGAAFAAQYRDLGDRAAKRLFTPPPDGRS